VRIAQCSRGSGKLCPTSTDDHIRNDWFQTRSRSPARRPCSDNACAPGRGCSKESTKSTAPHHHSLALLPVRSSPSYAQRDPTGELRPSTSTPRPSQGRSLDRAARCGAACLVPGQYHTLAALKPDTVIYEVKAGPYNDSTDKSFAPGLRRKKP